MSLRFGCKAFSIDKVLKCGFGINQTEYEILKLLLKKRMRASDLSKSLSKDQSTIQRNLNKLLKKGLVTRYQRNLKRGSYVFYYQAVNKDMIKKRVNELFDNFKMIVNNTLKKW
jgi:predicted transcriptional regulator